MNPLVRQIIGESAVVVKTRPVEYHVCPHCQQEIHEKSTFSDDGGDTLKHTCGGEIEFPETDLNTIVPWLRPYVEQTRSERKARLAAKTAAPPPKGYTVGDTTAFGGVG